MGQIDKRNISDFYFEPGLDAEVIDFILENQFKKPTLACQNESARWAKRLLENGFEVELKDGMFNVDGDVSNAEGHSWIEIDSCIFDPTSKQFGGEIDSMNYEAHEYFYEEDLIRHLESFGLTVNANKSIRRSQQVPR